MNKILAKKINNILDIDKDRKYINFSHENKHINLKNTIQNFSRIPGYYWRFKKDW